MAKRFRKQRPRKPRPVRDRAARPGDDFIESNRRIWEEHDPAREPWASMPREAIEAAMAAASDDYPRWAFLQQYLLDKCTTDELGKFNFGTRLATFVLRELGPSGGEDVAAVVAAAGEAAGEIWRVGARSRRPGEEPWSAGGMGTRDVPD